MQLLMSYDGRRQKKDEWCKITTTHMKNRSIARFKEPVHDTATQDGDSSTLDNNANFFSLGEHLELCFPSY